MLRAAVVSGDTASVEVVLEDSGHTQIHPVDSHVLGAGQAASYILEAGGGLWLSFHREHREAMGAGCAAFELLLQTAPLQDVVKMSSCGAQHSSLEELVLKALQHFGSSTVASAEAKVLTGPVGGNSAALHVALPEPSLLEVEVQFNFMLSNIHIWLDVRAGAGGGPALALGPTVSAQGLASAEKNTRAVLRLRLGAGEHLLRIRHDPAFPKEGGPVKIVVAGGSCAPLALKLRRAPLRKRLPIVDVPAAPVTPGADLVLQVSTASGALDLSSEPSLGNLPPAAAAQAAGALTLAWPSQSLARAEGRLVPAQDGFSRIWALPLRFEGGEAGEVWLALDALGSGRPWAGETAGAASPAAPPRAWPAPNEELPLPLPSAGRAEALLALPASPPNGGGIFTSRLLGWAAVLALLAYYTQNSAWLKAALWRAGLQRRSFSQQLAAAEMTSPWSWPRDASSARDSRDADGVAASATARSARMYGTLDL
ncbi:unnamed protein product [Effrenium voratum]|uniref:Uncharacterized protein n=1 Tax=Effrenium voratum TaxID=2562239 RepID=A0AA36MQF3_9DINO|nr:unnamed protein product [Effrenium voratum]